MPDDPKDRKRRFVLGAYALAGLGVSDSSARRLLSCKFSGALRVDIGVFRRKLSTLYGVELGDRF